MLTFFSPTVVFGDLSFLNRNGEGECGGGGEKKERWKVGVEEE